MKDCVTFLLSEFRFVFLFVVLMLGTLLMRFAVATPADPWSAQQTVQAAQFVAELQHETEPHPLVIYVGARALFNGGHIPGAVYYGPGSTEQGIADLKKYAATLPKNSDVVLYCGCCPLEKCPNLRPAFVALKNAGLARLRVLILPTSFNVDWVEKGYPVQKGN
jgi:hypothetical protein